MRDAVLRVPQSRNAIVPGSNFFRQPNDLAHDLYAEIERRGCGPCCAASAIHSLTDQTVHVEDLFESINCRGGFTEKGIVHSVLAELISEYGLKARAAAFDRKTINVSLAEAFFICSVRHKFPTQGAGGHLVLLHGRRGSQALFMDPSGWGSEHSTLPMDRFFSSYSGRAVRIDFPIHTIPCKQRELLEQTGANYE